MQYRMEKIGIHILAFFVARCQLLGMYPFVVPFFMAAYLQGHSSLSLFVVLLVGVLSKFAPTACLKYALVIWMLLFTLRRTNRDKIFATHYQIALAAGVMLWAVGMPYDYIVSREDMVVLYTFLEGVITACAVIVYEKGFEALRVGTGRMFATNERFVGIFALFVTALLGVPVLTTPIHLLFVICSYLVLYFIYRFGGGVGLAMGSVAGLVMAFRDNHITWLAVLILLSGLLVVLRELGKPGMLLGYCGGYFLLGVLYDSSLLQPELLQSGLVVILFFLFTPGKWLKNISSVKTDNMNHRQDGLIQEVTRAKVEDFGQAFLSMEKMLASHEEGREMGIPNGLSNMYLSGDGISLLNAVESQSNRLLEMRRNFVRQLGQIGAVISAFPVELSQESVRLEQFEGRVAEALKHMGVTVLKAALVKDRNGHTEVYISCKSENPRGITGSMLAKRLGRLLGIRLVCVRRADDMVEKEESRFSFVEEGNFLLTTGVVRRNRKGEEICGDNFSVNKVDSQKAVMMICDGMGYGENACLKSEEIVELLENLLSAGFCRNLAIELLNSFVSFLADGSVSSTLDLTMIDLYTGMADFVKMGASTTFIKRGNQVECIHSTSLPVGVLEQVEFDTCERRLYHGDMVIMMSDGVLDGIIFENKETYLADLIASIETNNAQKMAEQILGEVESMHQEGLRDDSTVLTVGIWER